MSHHVRKLDAAEVRRDYPLSLGVDGWFFRVVEVAPDFFLAEGTDLDGRGLSLTGPDRQELLSLVASRASSLVASERDAASFDAPPEPR